MASKKDQEDALRGFIKNCPKEGISKAPSPITPLSGYGVTYSRPLKTEPQEKLFVPITGTELMKKWSVGWEAIFSFAEQDALTPYKPARFRTCVKYDFGMLSYYSQQEREEYFSQWLYRPNDGEAFEKQHGKIMDEWRKKLASKEDNKPADAPDPQRHTAPLVVKSPDDHIKQRKAEGAKVEEIAFELRDQNGSYKLTYLEICRKLDLGNDLQPDQFDAMKKRAERTCKKGRAMLEKSGKRKKS